MCVQSDLSGALTAYIGSIPVVITYAPATAAGAVAFNTSVQFPPNNQLSAQAGILQICMYLVIDGRMVSAPDILPWHPAHVWLSNPCTS